MSDDLINSGKWKKPKIPEEMVHNHQGEEHLEQIDHIHQQVDTEKVVDHIIDELPNAAIDLKMTHDDPESAEPKSSNPESERPESVDENDYAIHDYEYTLEDEFIDESEYQADHIDTIDEQIDNEISRKFVNISEDGDWAPEIPLGEVAGVDTDTDGSLWVFHRADRTWDFETFDDRNVIKNKNPIEGPCVVQEKSFKFLDILI